MLERSSAAQCPSVPYQLAGAKKVQQDLAGPGVVERFVEAPEQAALIRACFAGALPTHAKRRSISLCLSLACAMPCCACMYVAVL
jgi:hypothetical protein